MRAMRMLLLVALCLAIGYGLKWYWDYRELHPATDDAYVQAHIVNIAARVSGPVIAVHVAENDYVEAGAPLFDIDPSTFQATVDSAEAHYELAAQDTGANDAELGVARSTLEERQVTLARAARNLERATKLAASDLIPKRSSTMPRRISPKPAPRSTARAPMCVARRASSARVAIRMRASARR